MSDNTGTFEEPLEPDALSSDVDDPVEALELSALWAASEAEGTADQTEMVDTAVPAPPEEAAVVEGTGINVEDEDELTTGLPAGTDVDRATPDDLLEAELTAISEGDPETAALLADDIERKRRQE